MDGDNGWRQMVLYGIDMYFSIVWPWQEIDADHACVASAIRKATCSTVEIANGAVCRKAGWSSPELLEYDLTMGPA
jgi:hypothetical protein